MNKYLKFKRLFLAGIITLALILGGLGVTNRIQAASSAQTAWENGPATTNGACWKCNG